MIVVDTNVIAYLWLPGAHTVDAERLLRVEPEWCVPLLWRSELRNVLSGTLRARRIDLADALEVQAQAERQLAGREYAVPSAAVLRAALDSGCSAYDCEFVVLARELGVSLVTTDKKVLTAFPRVARRLGA